MIKLLANRCRFHGAESYVLDLEGKGVKGLQGVSESKALLTIVGKEHTFETHKDLPISSKKEALLAAKHMKDVAPFAGQIYTAASSLDGGKTRVYFFVIKQTFIDEQCRDSLFILPESYLLFLRLNKQTAPNSISGSFRERLIHGEFSKDGFSCELLSLMSTKESGFFSAVQSGAEVQNFEQGEYIMLLLKSVTLLPSGSYSQALNLPLLKSFWSPRFIKTSAISLAVFFASYMSIASGYLILKENTLSSKLAKQQSSINELFAKQGQLENMNAQLEGLANNPLFEQLSAPLWLLITELADKGADVSLVNFSGSDITLRMKASKSTDIMHFLATSSALENPEIVSPAVKSGGKELFTVKITLVVG